MLEISTPGAEERLGVNFADIYDQSDLFQWAPLPLPHACCDSNAFTSSHVRLLQFRQRTWVLSDLMECLVKGESCSPYPLNCDAVPPRV